MTEPVESSSGPPETNSKVGRVMRKYDLTGFGDELEVRWKGEEGERQSLRQLAAYFNREVLRTAMEEERLPVTDDEVRHVYRILTDSEVSSGSRVQKQQELERNGIDVEELESDFVSHQAVHTYLKKYRGAEYETDSDQSQIEKDREALQRLQSRTGAVTEYTVERLRDTDRVSVGSFDVFVEVRIHCNDCGTELAVGDLLQGESCNCNID
ncbi:rod-determining factor RdfA [Halorussus salinisoli]|uniref:rod-determining factor RdfA n=1 Tax=Halorussus salinisoli TaxID=2558242 RepID=UPI0010C1A280|nr:rod-determining factor RdfA [Halorussus salinisoli]